MTSRARYRTIVADPPWDYAAGFPTHRGGKYRKGRGSRAETALPYPSMTIGEIRALPIPDLALPDAWLFMWATSAYLFQAGDIGHEWGFNYRQTIVWRKTGTPTPFAATVAPNHAEFLLVFKQGQPRRKATWPSSVIDAPNRANVDRHSQKPEVFLDFVETFTHGPYLELFARRTRMGWDTWGNEALDHVGRLVDTA
jgi:N6-adenosine-specific RNA methylase IME4